MYEIASRANESEEERDAYASRNFGSGFQTPLQGVLPTSTFLGSLRKSFPSRKLDLALAPDWRADHVWRFRSVRPLNVAPDPALPSITYSRVSGLSGLATRPSPWYPLSYGVYLVSYGHIVHLSFLLILELQLNAPAKSDYDNNIQQL